MPRVTTSLTDIFAVSALQKLQDSLAAMTGYGAMVVSCEGMPYTAPSGQCPAHSGISRPVCAVALEQGGLASAVVEEWTILVVPARFNDVVLGCWVLYGREGAQEQGLARAAAHIEALNEVMEQTFEWEEESPRQDAKKKKEEKDMMRSLQTLLQETHKRRGFISVAVVQLNAADANSAPGSAMQERLLGDAEEALRAVVRADDIVGRLQGGALVVALPGCARQLAEQRILQGQERLAQMQQVGGQAPVVFRFGLAENSELPFDKNAQRYARGMLELAQRRIREQAQRKALA